VTVCGDWLDDGVRQSATKTKLSGARIRRCVLNERERQVCKNFVLEAGE